MRAKGTPHSFALRALHQQESACNMENMVFERLLKLSVSVKISVEKFFGDFGVLFESGFIITREMLSYALHARV